MKVHFAKRFIQFQAMERKLLNKGLDQETASRYAEVDMSLKKLEQKLKHGTALEIGQRGSNKVSAMAEQFAPKPEIENVPIAKSVKITENLQSKARVL